MKEAKFALNVAGGRVGGAVATGKAVGTAGAVGNRDGNKFGVAVGAVAKLFAKGAVARPGNLTAPGKETGLLTLGADPNKGWVDIGGKLAWNSGTFDPNVGGLAAVVVVVVNGTICGGGEVKDDVGLVTGLDVGSINNEFGITAGTIAAPCGWVSTFFMIKQAMLNSLLSNLPSLFRSAKFHIWPKTLVGKFDLRKNPLACSPV